MLSRIARGLRKFIKKCSGWKQFGTTYEVEKILLKYAAQM